MSVKTKGPLTITDEEAPTEEKIKHDDEPGQNQYSNDRWKLAVLAITALAVLTIIIILSQGLIGQTDLPLPVATTVPTTTIPTMTQYMGAIAPPLTPYPISQFPPFNIFVVYEPGTSFDVNITTTDLVNFYDEPFDFNINVESEIIGESDWNWYFEDHRYDGITSVYDKDRFPTTDLLILVSPHSLGSTPNNQDVSGYYYTDWMVGGPATILIEDSPLQNNYTIVFIHEFAHLLVDKMFTIIDADSCSYSYNLGDTPCEPWLEFIFYEWIRDTICSWDEWGLGYLTNPGALTTVATTSS